MIVNVKYLPLKVLSVATYALKAIRSKKMHHLYHIQHNKRHYRQKGAQSSDSLSLRIQESVDIFLPLQEKSLGKEVEKLDDLRADVSRKTSGRHERVWVKQRHNLNPHICSYRHCLLADNCVILGTELGGKLWNFQTNFCSLCVKFFKVPIVIVTMMGKSL
ncbi:hypothetical protein CEXT_755911 [Caerostris extrusa]|uniref:Uncharacterized protein n=1 Tax=Caerostris extrusa TaxID=172846 RepID=A0AAV4MDZ3_CAEEX|nr:hypothetical protein CEXT_755911 [Caerostris extrusa]